MAVKPGLGFDQGIGYQIIQDCFPARACSSARRSRVRPAHQIVNWHVQAFALDVPQGNINGRQRALYHRAHEM